MQPAASAAVEHQPARGRFVTVVDGLECEAEYQLDGPRVVFTHTGVPSRLEGRGIAAALVKRALEWAQAEHLQVVPACSYVRVYLQRHPEFQELTLAPDARPSSSTATEAQQVLDFWFGAPGSAEAGQVRAAWFKKDPAFDAEIAERFGTLVRRGLHGELSDWALAPTTALAKILLLDQFTRNVFRGSKQAFAGDAQALKTAKALVDAGQDMTLDPLQRWFVYLPYEHDESLATQARSVALFERLATADARLAGALDYARRHQAVIQRFGRFPHRNAMLGRDSTVAELAYLAEPGSGF
ncbi:MAG: DUF924 family protein [Burkholderiaceae bacterium]|nr:DUF924 family protein [Burkholderiaceae bacterium]